MDYKKYPVGTPIKYIGYCNKCKGNTGKIVEVRKLSCFITLPHSRCISASYGLLECNWSDVEPLLKKGEQLEFSFMEQGE